MPLTFVDSSVVSLAADHDAIMATARVILVMGWFYPTDVTDARTLWSVSATNRLDLDGGKLRITLDHATDEVWSADYTVQADVWQHVSLLAVPVNNNNAGLRLWVGTLDTPPTEYLPENATPASGNVGGGTSFYIGNLPAAGAATAFNGDVADVSYVAQGAVGINSSLGVLTAGAVTDAEAANVLNRWVVPHWLGTPFSPLRHVAGEATSTRHFPLDCLSGTSAVTPAYHRGQGSVTIRNPTLAATVTGAITVSEQAAPRRVPHNWPCLAPFVRR